MVLETKFYHPEQDMNQRITDTQWSIYGYISTLGENGCNEAIQYDHREEIMYHLAPQRQSSISWYPFKENATVLEIGAEFGAVTGAFCDKAAYVVTTEPSLFCSRVLAERYKDRDNLTIYAGLWENIEFLMKFDYIYVADLSDKIGNHAVEDVPYVCAIEKLSHYLKPDGKLILADENFLNLCRFQQEKSVLNPNTYVDKLHKAQIERILLKTGFEYYKFYYPLPDHHVTAKVFTDQALPTAIEWSTLYKSNTNDINLLASNMNVLTGLSENTMFSKVCPAFFIEASKENCVSNIRKADVLSQPETPALHTSFICQSLTGIEKSSRILDSIHVLDYDQVRMGHVLEIELDLLKKLQEVCDSHGLILYAIYGTLLGCVRRAGMIPGDDDIDVALSRKDYNRLMELREEFNGKYFLQTPENDNCFFGGYLKLRNRATTAIHPQNWWVDCCEGIAIDIFPLDNTFMNLKKEKWKQKRIMHLQRLLYAKAYGFYRNFYDMPFLKWKIYKYVGKLFTRKQLADKLNAMMAEGDSVRSPYGIYAHYLGNGHQIKYVDRNVFRTYVEMCYMNTNVNVPAGWDRALRCWYGERYMEPLVYNEGKQRHGFYNTELPYEIYKNRFRGLFHPGPVNGEQIVLFGDGYLYDAYFENFGEDIYRPEHIVNLYKGYNLAVIHGIQIEEFEEYNLSIEHKEKVYAVICAVDVFKAERILQEAGYKNYYIYWHSREWMLLSNPWVVMKSLLDNESIDLR